jgi:hypothetical protein
MTDVTECRTGGAGHPVTAMRAFITEHPGLYSFSLIQTS